MDSLSFSSPLILLPTLLVAFPLTFKILCLYLLPSSPPYINLNLPNADNKRYHHIVVTGGSSGIGLCICKLLAGMKGVKVITIIARDETKMNDAKNAILSIANDGKGDDDKLEVNVIKLDLSSPPKTSSPEHTSLLSVIKRNCTTSNPPTMLFNTAGTATACKFIDTNVEEFVRLMNVNYMSTVFATKLYLPHMTSNKVTVPSPRVVITSSNAGQIGLYGYTSYSSSKFALMGFTQSLQYEVQNDNCYITLAFPPNTDTPGFVIENIGKPKLTRLMEDEAGLWDANVIASGIVDAACKGSTVKYFGIDGLMLNTLTVGMMQGGEFADTMLQGVLGGVFRIVGMFYLKGFRRVVTSEGNGERAKSE